jgi:hypothetical protein
MTKMGKTRIKNKYYTHKKNKYNTHKKNRSIRMTLRNRVNYGGSLIGQGNYGCAFKPDITNTKIIKTDIIDKNDNIVSKVVLKNNSFSEYRHEYKILKKLRTIDPKGTFHSLLIDAFDLKNEHIPPDFHECMLTKPTYTPDEFFVFNIAYCGKYNLSYYLYNTFNTNKDKILIPEPSILFTLITNILLGIKKMIGSNILHKTLDCDSIYFTDPITLDNPHSAKMIDYGDGELRKYKGFSDKNYDYITLFKSILDILKHISKTPHYNAYHKTIDKLITGFEELSIMVNKNNVSYNNLIKTYILLLETTFGIKYSQYAFSKYK